MLHQSKKRKKKMERDFKLKTNARTPELELQKMITQVFADHIHDAISFLHIGKPVQALEVLKISFVEVAKLKRGEE
jgi:hypothetical protein